MRRPLVFVMALGCTHHLDPSMTPDGIVTYDTVDGWTGDVRHYSPAAGTAVDRPPVLLVHGMGANHYNWDFRPEVSLAAYLSAQGYDVWVPALRGDQDTVAPSRRAARSITFDDIAEKDIPAILDAVRTATGHDQVDWVGHSMGGMLLYTTLAQWPDRVAAGVTIGSPATFPAPEWQHKVLAHAGWALGGRGRLHGAALGKAASSLFGVHTPGFGLVADLDNVAPLEANGLARVALTNLPRPMARQAASWMKAGTITRLDGSAWVSPVPGATAPGVPLLAIGATYDHVVPAANVQATCGLFAACTYAEVPYGHVDAVLGTTAQDVVYPAVGDFLSQ